MFVAPVSGAFRERIQAQASYNPAIGTALAIEGAERVGPDYAALQPDINATINGTHVDVRWDWSGFRNFLDQIEIRVDRRDGKGFVGLAFDTTPGYVDTQPFPASLVKWAYQAIYRLGDSRVGQCSKPVTVTVGR